ncbi:VWA domain-containing protein [Rubrimonas cliftonensis]|uniref:Ca-activated chloride channel family protein n=1 Tax=Rubrimonas cliftonensis TaxID=89524 RepID=A0A1H4E5G7_9RHOB|nr:VWA domain-containing protein [Rubrimonas cliftonensis]SEA79612.1 Ca-activated chloride channel family protein [Rubrimonas cliftonensis]
MDELIARMLDATPGFADPWALLLAPLPLLMLRYGPRARAASAAMAAPESVSAMSRGAEAALAARMGATLAPWVAWLALLLALAGPRTLENAPVAPPSGRDVLLAIDLSGSMERQDFVYRGAQARRIDVTRRVAADFVRGRAGDRVGLVVFGDHAFVAAAPSFDVEAVAQALEGMTIGVAGRSTAISDGLGLALRRLDRSDAPSRVVILLSDGTNTAGMVRPQEAAALAAEMGVRVHTIALGPLARGEGSQDRNAVDDVTLAQIAHASGGAAFRVRDGEDFRAVDAALDALEPSPTDAPRIAAWRDLWPWPAALSLLAAALSLALGRAT